MNSSEKFLVQWSNFKDNSTRTFLELREVSDFSDVTLACEGNHKIEAHKVILAGSSPILKDILKNTNQYNPLVYMRGVPAKDLVSIVDFIYHGEVSILQEDLNNFLALGEELQLKGITGMTQVMSHHDTPNKSEPNINRQNKIKKSKIKSVEEFQDYKPEISFKQHLDESKNYVVPENIDDSDLDSMIVSMIRRNGGIWQCKVCGKTAQKNRKNIMAHVEAMHMEGKHHPCNQCGKQCR